MAPARACAVSWGTRRASASPDVTTPRCTNPSRGASQQRSTFLTREGG